MTKFLRLVIPCLVTAFLAPALAAELPPKLLSGFEPGGPDFVKGQGTVVQEHATEGTHSFKVISVQDKYAGIDITDGAPLRLFKNYILFKVDVFNPQDQVVQLSARIDDASSKDYGSRYNDDTLVAPPGPSTITINLTGITRSNARNFAERTAVNTPLQGTAADLIKLAMLRIAHKLEGMQAKMLLQVHDELVFEAPPEEVDRVRALAKSEMEGVRKLDVPLLVDVGVGDNWRDAK